ncbi:chorismate-binding protein [Roseateles sp. BYS180W]|uniref:Chorismate-binding protein n=1 Tax=Roseateles rivi TaxID=3299028 RepID=A0ABW7FZN7_9BURK
MGALPVSPTLWAAFDFPLHPLSREDGQRLRGTFWQPAAQQLCAWDAQSLRTVLQQAHAAALAGAWVLGGLRYEAAAALDPSLSTHPAPATVPLAEFHIWTEAPAPWPEPGPTPAPGCGDWLPTEPEAQSASAIERIRDYIRAGDCYQINLTTRLQAQQPVEALDALFWALRAAQPGGFALYLRGMRSGDVASVSPELFFDWRPLPAQTTAGDTPWLLAAQPMKGTAPRGADAAADEAAQQYLHTSAKERAENLMIVDLLRNDLSRVARTGTVRVPRLFELHALSTVWQMTSTVTALSRPGLGLDEVMAALFPCGSVTGAPKRRAMQVITELETQARGWYCGALGLMQPGGALTFNVPIRTVQAQPEQAALCGIGSGITLDSEPSAELAEWRAKARFLWRAQAPVAALETLRLQDGVFQREARHRARMQRCARQFGLPWSDTAWRSQLQSLVAAHPQGAWRVRLTLNAQGLWSSQATALQEWPETVPVALCDQRLDTQGAAAEFVRHKTTRREHYEQRLQHKPAQALDVLLVNAQGELTEGCLTNLALCIDGQWLTPPLSAGLLAGVMRQELLEQGRILEQVLRPQDLQRASAMAVFNSVRGWCKAQLVDTAPTQNSPASGPSR